MSCLSADDVVESFQMFDISIGDEATKHQLVEVAAVYGIDGDELVNQWLAFQSRNQRCTLDSTNMDLFEKELKQNHSKQHSNSRSLPVPQVYDSVMVTNDDILEAYCSPAAKKIRRNSHSKSPATPLVNKRTQELKFQSPPTLTASPSQKFLQRNNSGSVVAQLCEGQLPSEEFWSNALSKMKLNVTQCNTIANKQMYMFQKIIDICDIFNDAIEIAAEELQAHHKLDEYSSCSTQSQNPVVTVGRISSESGGKLHPQSLILEGDRVHSFGRRIPLDISQLQEFSLFPGQAVAVEGTNPSGQAFLPTKIYTHPPSQGRVRVGGESQLAELDCRHVVVAAGPFTTTDTLTFDPLKEFVSWVQRDKPHLTIFIGPLLDENHPHVANCLTDETFDEIARKWMNFITASLEEHTTVIFVPSSKDVFHHPVFPQPPYNETSAVKHVNHMPDPVSFDTGDLRFGVTSTDVLFHLGAAELSRLSSSGKDRMSRLCQHLLTNRSFYPMYPCHESVPMDYVNSEFGCRMPEDRLPEVLILPSDLRYFLRCVDGHLCVNPGHLARGENGGTYAELVIGRRPSDDSDVIALARIVKI